MLAVVRNRRPSDTWESRDEMVQAAWTYLASWSLTNPYPVTFEILRRQASEALRKGVRDTRAYECQLPINAYARWVAMRQVQGVGDGYWPRGTRPSEFAEVVNTSGEEDEVLRRRKQRRSIASEDAELLYAWVARVDASFDEATSEAASGYPEAEMLMRSALVGLERLAEHGGRPVNDLAHAYAEELHSCLISGQDPESLSKVARSIGLVGGTHTRSVEAVRSHLKHILEG